MKNNLLFVFLSMLSLSCVENENGVNSTSAQTPKDKHIDSVQFYYEIRAADELWIRLTDSRFHAGTLSFSRNDSMIEIGKFSVKTPEYGMLTGIIKFPFGKDSINILLSLTRSGIDTVYKYTIQNYVHTYLNIFQEEKLFDITHSLQSWSLTPDNSVLFYLTHPLDGVSKASLYSYIFATKEHRLIDSKFDGLKIRALDPQTVLTTSLYVPNNKGIYPVYSGDSTSLCKYNVNTKRYEFVLFMSESYGRMTEVVRNHMVVNRPYFDHGLNSRIIDFTNNSIDSLTINWVMLDESARDNFWLGNYLLDEKIGQVQSLPFSTREDFNIHCYDAQSGYLIGSYVRFDLVNQTARQNLQVYRNNTLIFAEPDTVAQTWPIRLTSFNNNKLYYYRSYTSNHYKDDGIYEIDLTTKTRRLVKNARPLLGYWISNTAYIVISPYSVYKYSL